jgi:hypothetical protein
LKKTKEKIMSKERILPYKMAKKISEQELRDVAAAGWTNTWCAGGTWNSQAGSDGEVDVTVDF